MGPLHSLRKSISRADNPGVAKPRLGHGRWTVGLLLLSGVIAAPVAAVAAVAAQRAAPSAATKLLRTALSDAHAQGSAHETEIGHSTAIAVASYQDNIALDSGNQTIDSSNGLRTKILVVNGTAYLKANQKALTSGYGFSTSIAEEIGNSWVEIPLTDSKYASIASDVTLASALQEVTPLGHLTLTGPAKIGRTPAIGISGAANPQTTGSGSITLYVSRSATPLPIAATATLKGDTKLVIAFTRWGEHLVFNAPADALAITDLGQISALRH